MAKKKTHPDVEFVVSHGHGGGLPVGESYHKTMDAALRHLDKIMDRPGDKARIDVLCWSRSGAKWCGLEEDYDEDPDASVTARMEYRRAADGGIDENYVGRVA